MDIELETDENLLEAVENLPDEELDNIDFAYRPVPVEKGVSVTCNNITVYPRKPKISPWFTVKLMPSTARLFP